MKKMKHMLVFALVFAMLLSMAPMTAARAEETDANAEVTEVSTLEDLQTAIGEGKTAITVTNVITVTEEVILTANSPVVITTGVTDVFTVEGGKLTLGANITVNGTSSILWVKDGGEVLVQGATLASSVTEYAAAFVDADSKLTVESGTISGTGVGVTISAESTNATVEIKGGKVLAQASSAIAAIGSGTVVTISGGEVTTNASNMAAAYSTSGATINVTNGELTNGGATSATLIAAADGIVVMNGGSVNNGVLAHENANASATISGGTVTGTVGANNEASLEITGGTFTVDPSAYVDKEVYVVTQNTEGKWTVDEFTAEASVANLAELQAALEAGKTDITVTGVITVVDTVELVPTQPVTITTSVTDVFTVTGTLTLGANIAVNGTSSILWVKDGGEVLVQGATLASSAPEFAAAFVDANSRLTVESGTISGTGEGVTISAESTKATVEIKGGKILAQATSAIAAIGSETIVTISGGEVTTNASNMAAAYSTSGATINVTNGELTNGGATSATLIAAADGIVVMSGGSVNNGVLAHENANASATISGGTVTGTVGANNEASLEITGGTFTEAPAADYIADGYVAIPNADDTWTIAEAAPVKPEVVPGTEGGVSEDIADAAEEAGITEETLKEALAGNDNGDSLKAVLPTVEVSADEAKSALGNKYNPDSEDEVTVEVRPSVSVEVTGLDAAKNTMTLDITASYATYAVQGNEEAEITGKSGDLDLAGKTMTITVPLPEGFTGENVLVNHSKDDVIKETIVARVDAEAKTITFKTTMGFSTFEVVDVDVTHNLTLDSEIAFSFFIDKEDLETTNGYIATIYKNNVEAEAIDSAAWLSYSDNLGDAWRIMYKGVAAKEMTDELKMVVTDAEGTVIITDVFSVRDHAKKQIDNNTTEKELMLALLNYGAEAQLYFGYKTENLANEGYNVDDSSANTGETISNTTGITHNLNLSSKIAFSFFVEKSAFEGVDGLSAEVKLESEEAKTISAEEWISYTDEEGSFWRIRYDWVAPKKMDEKLELKIVNGDVEITDSFSVNDYAQLFINNNSREKELMIALKYYGKVAKEFFGN